MNSRELCAFSLLDILNNNSYNNLALKKLFKENSNLLNEEKAFITEVVNGTLRNIIFIDFVINSFSKTNTKKIKPLILSILRTSTYQIFFMEKIPDSAVCNEAVKITKNKGFQGLSGFVNGVLRNISRNKNNISLPCEKTDPLNFLSIKYSYPTWIINLWLEQFSFDEVKQMCFSNSLPPKISICINTNKITKENLKISLKNDGINFEDGVLSKNSLYIFKTKDISNCNSFKNGYFHIMDESSMKSVEILDPKPNKTLIDICSAPGGKSFYSAYLMQNLGTIFSNDIHPHKIQIIESQKARLGINIINSSVSDACVFNHKYENIADYLILDVPCSGLGILRKKPDIKYNKSLTDIDQLVEIQRKILSTCYKYVKKGGIIIYSTCTISKKENIDNVNWFIKNFDFQLVPFNFNNNLTNGYIQITPNMFETDGFFIAKLKRIS